MPMPNQALRVRAKALLCLALVGLGQPGWAETSTRSPSDGIAVLDCAPTIPSLDEACTLRIPPLQSRGDMRKSISDSEGEFEFIRNGDRKFPNGLHVSATMLLIDETPGPGGKRNRTLPLERALISNLIDALPQNELVAVYAFNEAGTLHPLAEYTVSRKLAQTAVADMQTMGLNTHIATNLRDAIRLMSERDDVLFHNIIVVTDGEEEGIAATEELNRLSTEKGVVVSSLGMFWRPEGSAQVGLAKDYLGSRLTTRDFGLFETIPLNAPDVARARIADFGERYRQAVEQSGLIVPVGKVVGTDLVVETMVPVVGAPGQTKTVEHVARFGASGEDTKASGTPPTASGTESADAKGAAGSADQELWFGYPRLWYLYGGAGFAGFVLLVLIGWLISRSRTSDGTRESLEYLNDDGPSRAAPSYGSGPNTTPVLAARPLVLLMREDTRERLALNVPGGTIGRAPNNQLVLSDDSVSRIHSEIRLNAGAVTLSDAGSLNGTLLNGKPLKAPAWIKTGDTIGLGNLTLRVTLPAEFQGPSK